MILNELLIELLNLNRLYFSSFLKPVRLVTLYSPNYWYWFFLRYLFATFLTYKASLSHAPSTINWISAFSEFNRYMGDFRKFFESKRKCKCLIIITLPFWLVPRLFARLEKCSFECIIPLDINEFLFVRYIFKFCCKVTHFSRKTCRIRFFFIVHPNV